MLLLLLLFFGQNTESHCRGAKESQVSDPWVGLMSFTNNVFQISQINPCFSRNYRLDALFIIVIHKCSFISSAQTLVKPVVVPHTNGYVCPEHILHTLHFCSNSTDDLNLSTCWQDLSGFNRNWSIFRVCPEETKKIFSLQSSFLFCLQRVLSFTAEM